MIEQYFPSKRVVVTPIIHKYSGGAYYGNNTEELKASHRGLSIEEYRKRVVLVATALIGSKWAVGQTGFPHTKEEMENHGPCRVVALVTHYDNYGKIEWNPECPYLLAVRPSKGDVTTIVNCSLGWLVKEDPTLIKETC